MPLGTGGSSCLRAMAAMGYQQKILEHFRSALPDTTDLTEDQVWITPAAQQINSTLRDTMNMIHYEPSLPVCMLQMLVVGKAIPHHAALVR